MIKWLHHLFNPHCAECQHELEEKRVCTSCETLKLQLSIANAEKQQMLNSLLEKPKPELEVQMHPPKTEELEKLKPRMITWNILRQMLEAEDRETAKILKEQAAKKAKDESIDKLEREMGINHDETIGGNAGESIQAGSQASNGEKDPAA